MLTGSEGYTRRLRYADFRLLRNRWTRRRRFRARAECYRESLRGPQESARARDFQQILNGCTGSRKPEGHLLSAAPG